MRRTALAFLLIAGCTTAAPKPPSVTFLPDAGGLAIAGSAQRIDFGRAPAGVIAALDRELGPHHVMPLADCPGGIARRLAWGGLELSFTDERFVGWREGANAAGITCA